MSKPLTREQVEEFIKTFIPQSGEYITLGRKLLAHDAALRQQLAEVTLASRTAVEINHVHEDEIDTLRQQLDGADAGRSTTIKDLMEVQQQLATARHAGLEEAAQVCDQRVLYYRATRSHGDLSDTVAMTCAEAIRQKKVTP